MFDERFFHDSHPPDEVLAMLGGLGFEIMTGEFLDLPEPAGDKGRHVIVARTRANVP